MKFIVAISVILMLVFSACGSSSTDSKPVSIAGTWQSTNDNPPMIAHIFNGKIVIDIADEGGSALYWAGTLDLSAANGDKLTSHGDVKAMGDSITGSEDKTKVFTYSNGNISFKFGFAGKTYDVKLKKS